MKSKYVTFCCDEAFPFVSYRSGMFMNHHCPAPIPNLNTSVKTKRFEILRFIKQDVISLRMIGNNDPDVKNKFILSSDELTEADCFTYENSSTETNHNVLTKQLHCSDLDGSTMKSQSVTAFAKALGKTLLCLHRNSLTMDWQNYRITLMELGDQDTTVRIEGRCLPILTDSVLVKDRLHYQHFASRLVREVGASYSEDAPYNNTSAL